MDLDINTTVHIKAFLWRQIKVDWKKVDAQEGKLIENTKIKNVDIKQTCLLPFSKSLKIFLQAIYISGSSPI